jgi:hypothetical protein
MIAPESCRKEIEAMPAILRALLQAELAAGNEIAEIGHTFPAPPAGAYFRLTKPLLTRGPVSGDGIVYYDRKGSTYSGEITDAKRFYFLLEPPHPPAPEPEPDMQASRAARSPQPEKLDHFKQPAARAADSNAVPPGGSVASDSGLTPVQRFERSMVIDFEKWHDGVGYDLEALREMSRAELAAIEAMLLARGMNDWRDVEALAQFKTSAAHAALRAAMKHPNAEVRNAVMRYAPDLISNSARIASLVDALQTAELFGGLSLTLDQVADFHPAPIVEALFNGALERTGDVAVHFAAMLCFIHGRAAEPFDMAQRPFFLRFNTDNRAERETVFRELCEKIGVDAARYLPKTRVANE